MSDPKAVETESEASGEPADKLSESLAEEENPQQAEHAREIYKALKRHATRNKGLKNPRVSVSGARPAARITVTDEADAYAISDLLQTVSMALEDREPDRNFDGRQANLKTVTNPEGETVVTFLGGSR